MSAPCCRPHCAEVARNVLREKHGFPRFHDALFFRPATEAGRKTPSESVPEPCRRRPPPPARKNTFVRSRSPAVAGKRPDKRRVAVTNRHGATADTPEKTPVRAPPGPGQHGITAGSAVHRSIPFFHTGTLQKTAAGRRESARETCRQDGRLFSLLEQSLPPRIPRRARSHKFQNAIRRIRVRRGIPDFKMNIPVGPFHAPDQRFVLYSPVAAIVFRIVDDP